MLINDDPAPRPDWLSLVTGSSARRAQTPAERKRAQRARQRQALEAARAAQPPEPAFAPDVTPTVTPDADAVTEPPAPEIVTPNEAIVDNTPVTAGPDDLAALDKQLLSAAAQLTTVRSEIIRLKQARQVAEAKHEADQERRALRRFAEGETLSDQDFSRVGQALQRDPRATAMPSTVRPTFYRALAVSQELAALFVELSDVNGVLTPTLIEGAALTPDEQDDVQRLLGELAECDQIIPRGGTPQKG